MDRSEIQSILRELNLNEYNVANIYHHGSWVYKTNSPTSDRDLIIITRLPQQPLIFHDDFDYFHEFELHRLWNKYDVAVYSIENFQILLEKNYLITVQCVFLPNEFKIKEDIDFRKIYLEKYYNQLRLKLVVLYELDRYLNMYKTGSYSHQLTPSSKSLQTSQSRMDYIFKQFFHGLRYLNFVEQLIKTRSIYDYTSVSYIFEQMKEIRGDPTDQSSMER